MAFRSLGASSRNAQSGRTIAGFQKPIAAGTRTASDVALVTGLDATIAFTVVRTAGSKSAATMAVQLRRSRRRRQSPVAKRSNPTLAPRAQARKTKSAQRPGIVIAGRRLPHGMPDDVPAPISPSPAPKP